MGSEKRGEKPKHGKRNCRFDGGVPFASSGFVPTSRAALSLQSAGKRRRDRDKSGEAPALSVGVLIENCNLYANFVPNNNNNNTKFITL